VLKRDAGCDRGVARVDGGAAAALIAVDEDFANAAVRKAANGAGELQAADGERECFRRSAIG
jgi:hypothetical protein